MANLEERVTHLEGQAENQTNAVSGLQADVAGLRVDVVELRAEIRTSVAQLRSEMATRADIADVRREMGDLRSDVTRRIDLLDAKVDRHFVWLAGIMVSGFIAVIGALVGIVYPLN